MERRANWRRIDAGLSSRGWNGGNLSSPLPLGHVLPWCEGGAQAAMRPGSLAKAAFFVFLVPIIRILAAPAAACRSARIRFGSSQNPGCGAVCSDAVVLRSLETSLTRRQTMQKGTVKWFNPTKGYGFIRPSSGDKDVFVHISAVERAGLSTLNEGQTVEYELVTNRGKTSAENLKVS
jgi:cold shock protein